MYFSVIMPTYGVEKYIKKAIESIRAQTFGDWELIVVDDCGRDRSVEIAEAEAQKDERIRIVRHEKNQGLSAARNTGIQKAKGEYIWFMDPDDYVDCDLLEKINVSLKKNPAEVVLFGLTEEYYGHKGKLEYTHILCPEEKLYEKQEELRRDIIRLEQATLYGYAWNKVYNLRYLRERGFRYENVKLIEDIQFNVQYFMDIQRLNILGIAPYHYAKRMESNLTNKFVPEYYELHKKRIELLYDQYTYWGMCNIQVRRVLGSLYGRYILSALERNCDRRSDMGYRQRYQWCKDLFGQKLFRELIPAARAKDSHALQFLLVLLRWKSPLVCMSMGRIVYVIRKYLPMAYSKVKSGR